MQRAPADYFGNPGLGEAGQIRATMIDGTARPSVPTPQTHFPGQHSSGIVASQATQAHSHGGFSLAPAQSALGLYAPQVPQIPMAMGRIDGAYVNAGMQFQVLVFRSNAPALAYRAAACGLPAGQCA